MATHCGLLKRRKQQRGVRPLEGALRRTVPDRSNTTTSRTSRTTRLPDLVFPCSLNLSTMHVDTPHLHCDLCFEVFSGCNERILSSHGSFIIKNIGSKFVWICGEGFWSDILPP